MAIVQSPFALGQKLAPVSREARGVVVERYTFTIDEDLASGDIIELAILPAYHFVADAVLITGALGAGVTADVGIMSGPVGDPDTTRTCGDELYAAADVAAAGVTRATAATAFSITPAGADRSIGVQLGDDVTASGQEVTLVLFTAQ